MEATRCPSIEEWIKRCGIYVQWSITQTLNNAICSNVHGPRVSHWAKKSEKEKHHICFMWNLKRQDTNELTYKTDSQTLGSLWLLGEGWGEGTVTEFQMEMYTLLYLKWMTRKDLLHSTVLHARLDGAGSLGENGHRYMYGWVPLLFT